MVTRSRGHWRTWPEFQFSEENPDPSMKPSVDALSHKLRQMSMLKQQPDTVEYVIHDMLHWFFIREKARPSSLFRILMRVELLWRMALRADAAQDIVGEGAAFVEDEAMITAASKMPEDRLRRMGPDIDIVGGEKGFPVITSSIIYDARMVEPVDMAQQSVIDTIAEAVEAHQWQPGSLCTCGKTYSPRHVAIRVKRRLVNEFPPIGQEATEEASASPST